MSWRKEAEELRRSLHRLAAPDDDDLEARYVLGRPPVPREFYRKLPWAMARMLQVLENRGVRRASPWTPRLRHAEGSDDVRAFVIWAVGIDQATLRAACPGFQRLAASLPSHAPVLVTDIADFAFFSRLGWLVEFLPELRGEGASYRDRKAKFLARLYRPAPVLPVSAGLAAEEDLKSVRTWVCP